MAKYIKKKHLKNAVEQLPWYHISKQGKLIEGAYGDEDALVKYSDVKRIVKGLPTKKIAEQRDTIEVGAELSPKEYYISVNGDDSFRIMRVEQVTGKLADEVIPTDIERGVWDYKGDGKLEQTERSE